MSILVDRSARPPTGRTRTEPAGFEAHRTRVVCGPRTSRVQSILSLPALALLPPEDSK